jgi:transcriptional regulator GlxA family with amidase domain
VRGPNGVWIDAQAKLGEGPRPDILIAPNLLVPTDQPLTDDYGDIADQMRRAFETGAMVASVCSGSLLTARAGLLDGREATTHWGYCGLLAELHPKVRLMPGRILVPTGPEHRIITAGGASAWNDLLIYLIARMSGPEEAVRISKLYLLQAHEAGQQPFRLLATSRHHGDRVIAESQRWVSEHLSRDNPVAAMAQMSGLPERSFHRRFRQATGMPPLAYVQALRIEEAKTLLETTQASIEEVGAAVGYAEAASFRKLFRRAVGVTPSDYRRRFQPLVCRGDPGALLCA